MFQNPDMIAQINGVLVTNFLEIIKDINDKIKFVQASSREIFGEPTLTPQTEKTPKNRETLMVRQNYMPTIW